MQILGGVNEALPAPGVELYKEDTVSQSAQGDGLHGHTMVG